LKNLNDPLYDFTGSINFNVLIFAALHFNIMLIFVLFLSKNAHELIKSIRLATEKNLVIQQFEHIYFLNLTLNL